ncbi:MAG: hypothetical protein L6420_12160 [Elusimicrobia bacterium]|nr:hypothetical protein [Elusimicrobiota bacterium]
MQDLKILFLITLVLTLIIFFYFGMSYYLAFWLKRHFTSQIKEPRLRLTFLLLMLGISSIFALGRNLHAEWVITLKQPILLFIGGICLLTLFSMFGDLAEFVFRGKKSEFIARRAMSYIVPFLSIVFLVYAFKYPQTFLNLVTSLRDSGNITPYQQDAARTHKNAFRPSVSPLKLYESQPFPDYEWGSKVIKAGELVVVEISTGIKWFPNITGSPNGKQSIKDGDYYYFSLNNVFGRYSKGSDEYDLFRLNPPGSLHHTYQEIGDIAQIDSTILVTARPYKLFAFDTKTRRFTSQFFGGYKNIATLVPDIFSGDIWMPTFGHLDYYKVSSGSWVNVDSDLSKFGGVFGQTRIIPDTDYVFVMMARRNNGGISVFNKQTSTWEKTSLQVDSGDFVATSEKFFFAGGSVNNGFNYYIYIFDKLKKSWSSYTKDLLPQVVDSMIEELPYLRWNGNLLRMDAVSLKKEKDHPFALNDETVKAIKAARAKLKAALKKSDLYLLDRHGLSNYYLQGRKIMGSDTPYGKYKFQCNIDLPTIGYTSVVTETDGRVLVQTTKGLALLDPSLYKIAYFMPVSAFNQYTAVLLPSEDNSIIRICDREIVDFEGWGTYKVNEFELNLRDMQIKKIYTSKEFSYSNNEGDAACVNRGQPIKNQIILKSKEKVSLEWDGILIQN